MLPEPPEDFILRKLHSPSLYSYVVRSRRFGIIDTDLSYLSRTIRTLYYAKHGFHGGTLDLFRVLIRDALVDLSSRSSQV